MADPVKDPDSELVREMVDTFVTRCPWAPGSELRWQAGEFIKQAREGYISLAAHEAALAAALDTPTHVEYGPEDSDEVCDHCGRSISYDPHTLLDCIKNLKLDLNDTRVIDYLKAEHAKALAEKARRIAELEAAVRNIGRRLESMNACGAKQGCRYCGKLLAGALAAMPPEKP